MRQIERVVAAALAGVVVSSAAAQDAVQWRVEDGGNGHWYAHQIDNRPNGGWLVCLNRSASVGGHLATFSTQGEWEFVSDLLKLSPNFVIAYLGGTQGPECESGCSPSASWVWVDGTPWTNQDWYPWYPGEPNGCGGCGQPGRLQSFNGGNSWDDTTGGSPGLYAFVVEWSADCNGDGIVDYGQILDGTFADTDGNGVPDCCDDATCLAPVQWRVEDGGNGHWYQAVDAPGIQWPTASAASGSRGAHLATATSLDENRFLADIAVTEVTGPGWWIGGLYDYKASAWTWVTGEAWKFSSWGRTALGCNDQPDGRDATNIYCLDNQGNPQWSDDFLEWPNALGYIIEWSADCNGDGIVDYGQILDGTFEDADDNGVPDCCDAGNPCSDGAVQWRVEDGGNGHWYQAESENIGWYSAKASCEDRGGHLITITSPMERGWILSVVPPRPCSTSGGHWYIGAYQEPRDAEPADFRWVTGEPFDYTAWSPSSPSNSPDFCSDGEDAVGMFGPSGACGISGYEGMWNDLPVCDNEWGPGFIIEWSADCNDDGIVDYGQIQDGTFADTDGNGVPDCCDADEQCDPCTGDLNGDGVVGPPDLGILLAVWGTDGGDIAGADINGDGTVNASDLGPLLGAWGVCP